MKKDRELNMLENADDKTVELLSEVPVLTRKEKERILAMSKDKLNKMNRENNIEEQVIGVEQYNRPKWHSFAAIAACVVLVGGVAGTALALGKSGKTPDIDPMSNTSSGTSTSTTVTVGTATTASGAKKADTSVTAANTDLSNTAYEIFLQMSRMDCMCIAGTNIEVDSADSIAVNFDGAPYTYLAVTDSRFSSVDDVKNFFKKTVTDDFFSRKYYSYFGDNFSPASFKDIDGKLYYLSPGEKNNLDAIPTIASTPVITRSDDTSFEATFKATIIVPSTVTAQFKLDNGTWKLADYSVETDKGNTTDANTSSETANAGDADVNTAYAAMSKLQEIDAIISGSGVEYNANIKESIDMGQYIAEYFLVTDSKFNSCSDVENYLRASFTDSYLQNEAYIWGGNNAELPMFKEIGGKLYYLNGAKGGRFHFINAPAIVSQSDNNFEFTVENEIPGGETETIDVVCVKDNGKWKINNCTYSGYEVQTERENYDHSSHYDSIAESILSNFGELEDILYNAGFNIDENDTFTKTVNDSYVPYYRVVSDEYHSVQDITDFMEAIASDDYLSTCKESMYMNGIPRFTDNDGKLYMAHKGQYYRMTFPTFSVTDAADNSFVINATNNNGGSYKLHVKFAVNGVWKITQVEI